ncbi:MAG: hypothetical protein A2542_03910 [Parcubacteria group bacterium RIFOXYD2_FULL_52_8]|nr:MAG: hypothetical protein A2542_03910 [Parcubacteria group bacterium RIFOXYD2_FULL_52_8]
MSGHNKWSKIKHKKGAEDAKRSKVFSVFAKQIAMEAKAAKGDRNSPRLRTIIEKAKAQNFPNENIERAIQKGSGAGGSSYTEVFYEAYGPGGVGIIITGITDSPNRTNAEIKHLLSEHGGNLGGSGSVTWAFTKTAEGWEPQSKIPVDEAVGESLGALLDAFEEHDDVEGVWNNAE